jgi:hypothetical protein
MTFARRVVAVLWFACGPVFAPIAARADVTGEAGIFTAVIAGQHVGSDNPVPVSGVVPGAAIEALLQDDRFRFHLEGIPTVAATGSNVGAFGHSSASLDVLNTTALVDVDKNRRIGIGAGFQLVNLTNKNGDNGDVNDVRIASPIYALALNLPVGERRGFETNLMIDPNLRGTLLIYNYLGVAQPNKPEQGAEIDYAADYRIERGNLVYRFGFRGLSYHTRNLDNGELVDRNVGAGITFDARYRFGKR